MEGGIASGFRTVKPDEYKPRLFQVRQASKTIRAFEVPVKATSLDNGDTFILDAGLKVYIFIGPESNAFEKSKGGALAHNIVSGRQGKAKLIPDIDADFWKILGGSEKDVKPANTDLKPEVEDMAVDAEKLILYRLSDATGKITFTKVHEGKVNGSMLDSNDVFILDGKAQLFVWVGKGASHGEKSQAMKFAEQYMKENNRPNTLPVTRISEGQVHHVFGALIKW
jgi:hypothetical protein